jgi:protein TonB
VNPIRIALAVFLATLIATPLNSQEQNTPPTTPPAPPADQSVPPVPHPMRIRVGGNVQAAQMVRMVPPKFPEEVVKKHITGTVVLHIIVATDGTVKNAEYVSGPQELKDGCIEAAKQWRYKPTLLNHQPVEVDTTAQIVFSRG